MKLILIAAILVATATAYSYDEASFTEQPDAIDEILVDVNAGINAMKSKGAKESDCLDLAKTSCKEVERERSINQGLLNKLPDGSKCPPLGQGQVTKTKNHYLKTKTTWKTMKYRLTVAKNKRVYFANQKFNTMTKGNCGFVFSSRNYLNAKKALDSAILNERVWKGKTSEAHKAWQTAIKIAAKRKHICLCDAQVTASHVWSTVANSKLVAKQNRAHTKCKMMSCILKGKNVRSAQCQGSLPGLKHKVLTAATRKENCKGHKPKNNVAKGAKVPLKDTKSSKWVWATQSNGRRATAPRYKNGVLHSNAAYPLVGGCATCGRSATKTVSVKVRADNYVGKYCCKPGGDTRCCRDTRHMARPGLVYSFTDKKNYEMFSMLYWYSMPQKGALRRDIRAPYSKYVGSEWSMYQNCYKNGKRFSNIYPGNEKPKGPKLKLPKYGTFWDLKAKVGKTHVTVYINGGQPWRIKRCFPGTVAGIGLANMEKSSFKDLTVG
jgi:hypothetical protein